MPKPRKDSDAEADFVLKHRIVGAAVLLLFGALFVPWLLGPPSEAVKAANADDIVIDQRTEEITEEIVSSAENETTEVEEQVYISKITPLDTAGEATPEESEQPQANESGAQAGQEEVQTAAPAVEAETETTAQQSPAKVEPERETNRATARVDVGWAVQVGIYTSPNGVARVLADLRNKGFEPRTTTVDTNRGKGTGTRVWLGPFAQRVDAAKEKTRLTELTGEAGFIRVYP